MRLIDQAQSWIRRGLRKSRAYHVVTRWRVDGTREEVAEALLDSPAFVEWWSTTFLDIELLSAGDRFGVGREAKLVTRGWLPYRLRFYFRVVRSRYPESFGLIVFGDFFGRAYGRIRQEGSEVVIEFDWRVKVRKPLLYATSFLLKPLYVGNHVWTMARGQERLPLELAKRRAVSLPAAAPLSSPALGLAVENCVS
jgi:hypothetical protein